jgi:hypothetical protein
MIFNQKLYTALKQMALIWLPAFATFYVALAGVWHFRDVRQVVATVSALDTLLGAILHLSSSTYQKLVSKPDGRLLVDDSDPDKTRAMLDLSETDPHAMVKKKAITLEVVPAPVPHTTGSPTG